MKRIFTRIPVQMTAILVGLLLVTGLANAQTTADSQSDSITEFEVNGLQVLVRSRPNAKTVSGGLFVRGGARNIDEKTAGIENLTLLAATEASKNYSREVLRRELAKDGSGIGASVSNDYGVVSFATTSAGFDKTWKIFADVVMNPTFAKADVERVRELILTGLRDSEISADSYLDSIQEKVLYANHPYANSVGGTVETISSFSPNDLKAYHKKITETSRLLLVVVGNVDVELLKKDVTNTLAKLPKGAFKAKPFPKLDFSKSTLDVAERQLPTNYIRGVFDAPTINEPDYYPMRVAVTILRNRLFEEVREQRSLSYAPSADMDTYAVNTGNIYVTAAESNRTISIMLEEIKRLKKEPVPEDEIESVAGGFLTSYYLDQETNAAQVRSLAKYELVGGGWKYAFSLLDGIRAVTPEDVQAVARKYMKNLRFVVVGNPSSVNESIFLQSLEEEDPEAK